MHLEEERINRTSTDMPGLCYTLRRTLTAADVCFSIPVSETRDFLNLDTAPPVFQAFPVTSPLTVTCNLTEPDLSGIVVADACAEGLAPQVGAEGLTLTTQDSVIEQIAGRTEYLRTYTARDGCGLTQTRNQTIIVLVDATC